MRAQILELNAELSTCTVKFLHSQSTAQFFLRELTRMQQSEAELAREKLNGAKNHNAKKAGKAKQKKEKPSNKI